MKDNKNFGQRFAKLYSPFMERGNSELYDNISKTVSAKQNKPSLTASNQNRRIAKIGADFAISPDLILTWISRRRL